jgi:hypothetical protein
MGSTTKTKKRWQFAWCDADSPPANGDCHTWKAKTFRAASFEAAMDKMLAFVEGKAYSCLVDYECAALHEPYSAKDHDRHFKRIDTTKHGLAEYVG